MEFLKSLFTKPLSFEEFSEAATKAGIKLADLAKGEHVAKGKLTEATDKIKTLESKVSEYETTYPKALLLRFRGFLVGQLLPDPSDSVPIQTLVRHPQEVPFRNLSVLCFR